MDYRGEELSIVGYRTAYKWLERKYAEGINAPRHEALNPLLVADLWQFKSPSRVCNA